MSWELLLILITLSSLGGFICGLLGIGGGIIFVPVLSFVFEKYLEPGQDIVKYTLANSFLIILFASSSALIKHIKAKNLLWGPMGWVALAGIPISIYIAYFISSSDNLSHHFFNWLFLAVLVLVFVRMLMNKKGNGEQSSLAEKPAWQYVLVGLITAIVSGFTGVGGGVIMVPALSKWLYVPLKKAFAISTGVIVLLALVNTLYYSLFTEITESTSNWGFIVWEVAIYPVAAVVVFAPLGVWAAKRFTSTLLNRIFMVVLVVVFIRTVITLI